MKNITFLTTRQTFSNFKYGLIVLLCIQSFTLSATDYYVNAISGNDSNNGQSAFDAFRSISRMSSVSLRPGDTVYFMNGTYTRPGSTLWNITESGTENAYITIQNYPGHSPVLEFDSWSGLNLPNLRWSDSATTGDEIPTHIIVENCEIYDCPSSGLAFQQIIPQVYTILLRIT